MITQPEQGASLYRYYSLWELPMYFSSYNASTTTRDCCQRRMGGASTSDLYRQPEEVGGRNRNVKLIASTRIHRGVYNTLVD